MNIGMLHEANINSGPVFNSLDNGPCSFEKTRISGINTNQYKGAFRNFSSAYG